MRIAALKSSGCWGTVSKTLGLFSDYSKRGKGTWGLLPGKENTLLRPKCLGWFLLLLAAGKMRVTRQPLQMHVKRERGLWTGGRRYVLLRIISQIWKELLGIGGVGFGFLSFFFVRIQQNALKFKWFFIFYFLAVIRPLVSQTAILPWDEAKLKQQ